ncbi:MAG: winged helix-turn-helix domain-containing protein [Rhodospirillales bacterium]|jgi:predicted transcriptional regulator|nr:winged helix-turn-helix domain-containing protein [Rhodospirillales bacterium]MDK9721405.1 DNA-binding protein [Rhodospirillales bacterium]
MSKKKSLLIGLTSLEDEAQAFRQAWKATAKGETVKSPSYHLGFASLPEMLKALTPKRWALLEALKREGPLSVRALAASLKRDYKNVHSDVRALTEFGLIVSGESGFFVPFDIVRADIKLAA